MMQFAHTPLKKVKGLEFYRLLGVGKENFDPLPDWSQYGILQVWEDEKAADDFFASAKVWQRYLKHSDSHTTFFMRNIKAHGLWGGANPFRKSDEIESENLQIAVITRATIKLSKLRTFWKYVPTSQKDTQNNEDLLYTIGVGERPITQMCTFSIWKNAEALKTFAYRNEAHRTAVQKTRALQWYKEELFSRFQVFKTIGIVPEEMEN
jgi:heme-degrading monooxygenase HmoA